VVMAIVMVIVMGMVMIVMVICWDDALNDGHDEVMVRNTPDKCSF